MSSPQRETTQNQGDAETSSEPKEVDNIKSTPTKDNQSSENEQDAKADTKHKVGTTGSQGVPESAEVAIPIKAEDLPDGPDLK
jgi:hypothetical protein